MRHFRSNQINQDAAMFRGRVPKALKIGAHQREELKKKTYPQTSSTSGLFLSIDEFRLQPILVSPRALSRIPPREIRQPPIRSGKDSIASSQAPRQAPARPTAHGQHWFPLPTCVSRPASSGLEVKPFGPPGRANLKTGRDAARSEGIRAVNKR